MKIHCPSCGRLLPAAQLNLATDVALCANCDEAFSISTMVAAGQGAEDFDIDQPPRGASFERTMNGWRMGASTRSPIAFFLVPFMCIWSGFSLGAAYGSQIIEGRFELVPTLVGIPFLLATLLFCSFAAMTVCGKIVVSTDGNDGRIYTGVGPFGWTRRFDWSAISAVTETIPRFHYPGNNGVTIALAGQSQVCFGSMLSDARRYYLLNALRKQLANRGKAFV